MRRTIACRWCGDVTPAFPAGLCEDCANDGRIRRMFDTYNAADRKSWEHEFGLTAVFSAFEIFERDNWTCGVCGEEIDPDLAHPDPGSAVIDHIDPLPHGENTPENVRAAHMRCNITRPRKQTDPTAPLRFLACDVDLSRVPADAMVMDAAVMHDEAYVKIRRDGVRRAMKVLPKRERRILELRYGFDGCPRTYTDVGDELGYTRERVRQLEGQALSRLAALRDLASFPHEDVQPAVEQPPKPLHEAELRCRARTRAQYEMNLAALKKVAV